MTSKKVSGGNRVTLTPSDIITDTVRKARASPEATTTREGLLKVGGTGHALKIEATPTGIRVRVGSGMTEAEARELAAKALKGINERLSHSGYAVSNVDYGSELRVTFRKAVSHRPSEGPTTVAPRKE